MDASHPQISSYIQTVIVPGARIEPGSVAACNGLSQLSHHISNESPQPTKVGFLRPKTDRIRFKGNKIHAAIDHIKKQIILDIIKKNKQRLANNGPAVYFFFRNCVIVENCLGGM
jgi:hypothetical protein